MGLNSLREFERAVLPVKGEVVNVNGAGGAEDGRRQPVAEAICIHQYVTVVGHLELGIITDRQKRAGRINTYCTYLSS